MEQTMKGRNHETWKGMEERATAAAAAKGHKLEPFSAAGRRSPDVRTAMCETCYGCAWVARKPGGGFGAGGRVLAYECGTPEAAGQLRRTTNLSGLDPMAAQLVAQGAPEQLARPVLLLNPKGGRHG